MRIVALTMCLLAAGAAAEAQERPLANAGLPRAVESRLTAILEDPTTRQIHGQATVTEDHSGNLVAFKGPLTLGARIDGDLIVVQGTVQFEPGSAVTGDVTIVGGDAHGLENATIDGTITLYGDGFVPFQRNQRVLAVNSRTRRVYRDDDWRDFGRGSFALRTGYNYNRVEGLPVEFGPVIETGGKDPTRFEALAIWRTEVSGPFETDDWGYSFRAEQFLGGRRAFRLGALVRSVVVPIEDWQMRKSEASLASIVLHEDYRDYYMREGWSAYARFTPRATGLTAQIEYSDETHASQPARDPWTLFNNGDVWRFQPLAAEGKLRSLTGSIEIDRRDDTDFPASGVFVRAEFTRGLDGQLAVQPAGVAPIEFNEEFTRGLIDARAYRRVGNDGSLSFRVVGGGSFGAEGLAPQFQHALGGAGSLPGYSLFSADCGARNSTVTRSGNNQIFFPYYGCDRMALVSAEYRGGFDFHLGGFDWEDEDEDDDWEWNVDASPNWIVFFDAARGWASAESKQYGAAHTETLLDAGAGIVIGDVGIYGAVPLTGTERGVKFFVRFGPRF
jgi:hypothetical protein